MRGVSRVFRMILGWIVLAISVVLSAPAIAAPDLPRDSGLPLIVQAGASFLDLESFDENAGTFRATVDIRLRWTDKRLAKTGAAASSPPETLRDSAAEERMKAIWVPPVVLANQSGEAALSGAPGVASNGIAIAARTPAIVACTPDSSIAYQRSAKISR